MDTDFCELQCYLEPSCLSFNFMKSAKKCQLNNSTFERQKNKLEKNLDFMYSGAKRTLCSSGEYPSPPDRGHFCFRPPAPWDFQFRGCLSYPLPPGIFLTFLLGWVAPGKNIFVKNAFSLYYYAKCNCFCDKVRKNLFTDS